jgi:hypothetical protein
MLLHSGISRKMASAGAREREDATRVRSAGDVVLRNSRKKVFWQAKRRPVLSRRLSRSLACRDGRRCTASARKAHDQAPWSWSYMQGSRFDWPCLTSGGKKRSRPAILFPHVAGHLCAGPRTGSWTEKASVARPWWPIARVLGRRSWVVLGRASGNHLPL